MTVALGEVIHTGPAVEHVAVKLLGARARHLKPTAAQFGDKFGAIATTCHAVEFRARNWAHQNGLSNSQVTRVVGA